MGKSLSAELKTEIVGLLADLRAVRAVGDDLEAEQAISVEIDDRLGRLRDLKPKPKPLKT